MTVSSIGQVLNFDTLDTKCLETTFHRCLLQAERFLIEETKQFMLQREHHILDAVTKQNTNHESESSMVSASTMNDVHLAISFFSEGHPRNQRLVPAPGDTFHPTDLIEEELICSYLNSSDMNCSSGERDLSRVTGITSRSGSLHTKAMGSSDNRQSRSVDRAVKEFHSKELSHIVRKARTSVMTNAKSSALSLLQDTCCYALCSTNSTMERRIEFLMAIVVILNILQLGVSADVARDWKGWLAMDCLFAAAFLFEFFSKLLLQGYYVVLVVNWKWALFDAVVVVAAMVELVATIAIGGEGTGEAGLLLRIVRLLRLVRIIKVIRLPMFKDLLEMCDGLISGARTLFWSMVLLFTPVYASAILLRETVGRDDRNTIYVKPFTTIHSAFFTTFRCIMGDCSAETGQPLPMLLTDNFGWSFAFCYTCLVVIMSFGLFNVIIAIYVENIIVSTRKNDAQLRQQKYGNKERMNMLLYRLIRHFVRAHDDSEDVSDEEDGPSERRPEPVVDIDWANGMEISKDFFEEVVNKAAVRHIFDELDIPYEERQDLFDVLDAEATGILHLGAITEGLKKLRGVPRRSDIIANGLATRAMQKRLNVELDSILEFVESTSIEIHDLKTEGEDNSQRIIVQIGEIRMQLASLRDAISQKGGEKATI